MESIKMKLLVVLIIITGSILSAFAQQSRYHLTYKPRIEKSINQNWTFNYLPEPNNKTLGFEKPGYDDSKWSCISLPHTWQTYETTKELHPYIRSASASDDPYWWKGWGYYRKHLVIGKLFQGKRIIFEFDGIQKYSRVYLNGTYLGDHKGGYTSFYMDATDAVRFGEDNLLAIAVNNQLNDSLSIPPMSAGNFDVYGGIHRDVRIVVKDPLNIPFQGSYKHEGGTFITTPLVSEKKAVVNIKTFVQNKYNSVKTIKLVTFLTDSLGFVLERLESTQRAQPGQIVEIVQKSKGILNPHLWSPESPYIYKAYSEAYDGNRLTDCLSSTFGIRYFSWDYTLHRLILNGKVTQLHGINRHEEYVWLGAAFPKWIQQRDMLDIANGLEANFMRTAHYPQDPSIYHFTDQHGIVINEELPNIKKLEFNDKVQEQNCMEMIRRDRNHPSILFWSMGNETSDACDSQIAWKEDTTRILTVRQPYTESYNPKYIKHTDKEMPLESFLRCTIKGWYDKDDKNLEPDDIQWTGTEEWQHTQSNNEVISEHNGAVWLYADHGADREYVNAPLKHVNPKGWVDSWRNPKYAYYQWQANFAKKPMVFIHPHFWRKQYIGQKKDFIVDSNCESVELFVNGKSRGVLNPRKGNNYCVVFKGISVENGVIAAVGINKSKQKITSRLDMAGEPAALTIVPTSKTMGSNRDNVVEFKVDIVDNKGIHIVGANNPLRFSLVGAGKLVGPELYISDRDKNEEYEGVMYIDAPVTNLVRATGKTGKVKVSVSSPGLKPASAEIDVIPFIDQYKVNGIVEPAVSWVGREPVAINIKKANYIKAPAEMKEYTGEVRFPGSQKGQYSVLIKKFILKENPGIQVQTPEFINVVNGMTAILIATEKYNGQYGYIVADDYNFIVAQYNLSRAITRKIAFKDLPGAYKNELIRHYADQIVGKGKDKNLVSENDLIDRIPKGGKIFVIADRGPLKEVFYNPETNLQVLLIKIYPKVESYTYEDIKQALSLIYRLNPSIVIKSVRDIKSKKRTDTYTIESGSTILIPEERELLNKNIPDRKI